MLNKLDAAFSFHQTALRIRSQRQEIIAANIANADTPNYKARDIDFKSTMAQALSGDQQNTHVNSEGISKTSPLHMNSMSSNSVAGSGEPLFRPIMQGSVDGNSVDMDIERNQFVDNGIRYEASLTMINSQIKKMLAAIQGQ
ncbi:MAG: flagellar basal body rod protein FlgB [Methylophilus sp.]|nr:flagellar basal body rod protein FlgB [Methylophilus sp.]